MLNQNIIAITVDENAKNKIFVTVEGQELQKNYQELGLSFQSTEQEIINAISPIVRELFGVDIAGLYKVRKTTNNENIFVIPNSTAG